MELLTEQTLAELKENILPFWMQRMRKPAGGFYGQINGHGELRPESPVSCIMVSRILWTFSAAYRMLGEQAYLDTAREAKTVISSSFHDKAAGGTFWALNPDGTVNDAHKQIYAIAFAVYGLAEYHRATGDTEALELAISLFRDIESHSYDAAHGGYTEAFGRDWESIEDMRLSSKDMNTPKTMNTHLHILEAYTALYRVWKDALLADRLRSLILIFSSKIFRLDGHLHLFFSIAWEPTDNAISYGHEIECSWLLTEAAEVLDNSEITSMVYGVGSRLVATSMEGWSPEKGMAYGKKSGHTDGERHWWVQAESVSGFVKKWQEDGDEKWLSAAVQTWQFIRSRLTCPDGEWYWSILEDGTPNTTDDRAGFWKCPYHNGRMCIIIQEAAASGRHL